MSKRLTHEEFISRMNKINNNIEILEKYKNMNTKVKCKCKLDNFEWSATPKNLLNNHGCPKCSGNIKNKTTEYFINELKEINNNIEILGEYINNKTKIKCKCKIDGYEFEMRPNSLLSGQGCPKCYGNIKKTHKEFINELKEINNNIEILGEYVNSATKIKCRCKIDGYEWEATPNSLLRGQGCLKCSGKMQLTHEEFINRMNKINTDIEILGEYVNNHTKIKCKCKIDGYEWEATPNNLLNGQGCKKCGIKSRVEKQTKTHEEFINKMKEINSDIEILGEYVNCKTKIKCKCKIDGNIWFANPKDLLYKNSGCPKCNASKGEKRVAKYLDSKGIEYIHDEYYFKDLKNSKGNTLRPDFIIEDKKIWIEYDGEQHFRVVDFTSKNQKQAKDKFKEIQENDKLKNKHAKKYNWKLIRIPYWDFDRIEEILERDMI